MEKKEKSCQAGSFVVVDIEARASMFFLFFRVSYSYYLSIAHHDLFSRWSVEHKNNVKIVDSVRLNEDRFNR